MQPFYYLPLPHIQAQAVYPLTQIQVAHTVECATLMNSLQRNIACAVEQIFLLQLQQQALKQSMFRESPTLLNRVSVQRQAPVQNRSSRRPRSRRYRRNQPLSPAFIIPVDQQVEQTKRSSRA